MQHLLTEEELAGLKAEIKAANMREKEKVQKLCTLVASFKPVPRIWMGEDATPEPWGCVRNEVNNPGYCDNCPVNEECPYEHKEWSK